MGNYRLDLAYKGTGFHGYAKQPNVRTVQGELEAALARLLEPVESFVAGRTDKGVHAIGQVVSFSTDIEVDRGRVLRSLNKQLAPEIAVTRMTAVSDGFHARFSAVGRSYCYRILNRETPDPFQADVSWHFAEALDLAAMQRAVDHLLGEHDFASFCRAAEARSTVRDLRTAAWTETAGGMKELTMAASSFCHQMVRSIVALCVEVGRGRIAPGDVAAVLAARDRHAASGAAPPHGLTLMAVDY